MLAFLGLFAVGAFVTAAVTPPVARLARRIGAVDLPGPRKVHERPTPTLGGLAMLVGFLAVLGVAQALAARGHELFEPIFSHTSEPTGLLLGAIAIAALGVIDDVRELAPTPKLAGQLVAALLPVLFGIQLVHVWVPWLGVISLSPDLGVTITVLLIVAMVNAVNMIDGLDGLAAGVVAIGGMAFFAFAHGSQVLADGSPSSATLVAAGVAGIAVGFLVHNFHPARIFMGDTGAMLLGLLLASAGISFVGRTTDPGYLEFAGVFPLVMPALVLAVAFVDSALAVVRRFRHRRPLSSPDRSHLHHRLLRTALGHRRAVLVLYYWSALVAFGAAGVTYLPPAAVGVATVVLAALGVVLTTAGVRRDRALEAPPSRPDRSSL